ncbi:MAG TPA: HAMP domain-containing protein, partial [Bacillota bacterium]|nr:HAMP domain-containing protein [Bacillota bacterium]
MGQKMMFFLNRLSFQAKIWFIIGIQFVALVIVTVISLQNLNTITNKMDLIHQVSFESINRVLNADRDFYQALNVLQTGVGVTAPDYLENISQIKERMAETKVCLQQDLGMWQKGSGKDSNKSVFDLLTDFEHELNNWEALNQKNGKITPESLVQFDKAREVINQIGEIIAKDTNAAIGAIKSQHQQTVINFVTLDAVICLLILLCVLVLIKVIKTSLTTITDAAEKIAVGDVEVHVESWSKDEIGRLAKAFNGMIQSIREQSTAMEKIASGDFAVALQTKSDRDILTKSIIKVVDNLKNLIQETERLTQAAVEGELDTRGRDDLFEGGFKELIQGFNRTLDAVTAPLNESGTVLGRMALNDYTIEMNGKYQGKMQQFADAINAVHTRLLSVQDVIVRVSKGDTSRLEEFRKIGKRSENDQLMPGITRMMEVIQDLVNEAKDLGKAATNGNLTLRGEARKFEGGYREIVEGFNSALDAMIEPVQEAETVMQELAKGNLQVSMEGNYRGDFAVLKEAINTAIEAFNNLLAEINNAATQVAAGSEQVSR